MKARALVLIKEQRFSEARELYKNLCESDADDMDAWFMLTLSVPTWACLMKLSTVAKGCLH
jgi:hypothetical protein